MHTIDFTIPIYTILVVPATIQEFLPGESVIVVTAPLKIELSCTGKGRPAPTITWYKGEDKVLPDNNHGKDVASC